MIFSSHNAIHKNRLLFISEMTMLNNIQRDEVLIAFGENLKDIRESMGLTQEMLAKKVGFHRTHVSQLELGQRNPALLKLRELCQSLDVSITELLADVFSELDKSDAERDVKK